ncbi:MAG: hypothetical protein FJW39_00310 [Acidobacteria bacterium]|nr:hypothetical protein [Acidobacteriota bacterium]
MLAQPELPMQNHKSLYQRQSLLINANITQLRQGVALLGQISDLQYSTSPRSLPGQTAGGHIRHILEFYECLLGGLDSTHVDYDARRRDPMVQNHRGVAIQRLRAVMDWLSLEPTLRGDGVLMVRMEDAPKGEGYDTFLTSSVARELQVLASHTVHHFALVSIILKAHGAEVEQELGVAPSTLRYSSRLVVVAEAA